MKGAVSNHCLIRTSLGFNLREDHVKSEDVLLHNCGVLVVWCKNELKISVIRSGSPDKLS